MAFNDHCNSVHARSLGSRPYFSARILLRNRGEMGLVNCLYRFCSEPHGSWGSLIFSNHGNNDIHGKVALLTGKCYRSAGSDKTTNSSDPTQVLSDVA